MKKRILRRTKKEWVLVAFMLSACNYTPLPRLSNENSLSQDSQNEGDPNFSDKAWVQFSEINRLVIQPYCINCHNPLKSKGNVDLSSLAKIRANNRIVKFGDPNQSLLYLTILEGSMPPRGELPSPELTEKVRQWIADN
jgi:hypothetical protein